MLYNIVLVSAMYHHESAIGICMSPLSWNSLQPIDCSALDISHKEIICGYLWLFHLAICFQDSLMLWHVSVLHFFLGLNSIPLFGFFFVCSLLMYIWIISPFWILWTVLLRTFGINFYGYPFLFPLGSAIAGSYGDCNFMINILRDCQFPKVPAAFSIPTSKV